MICEDLKQPDKEIEPSIFEEDGVEKVLKCALVRDKNNRERFAPLPKLALNILYFCFVFLKLRFICTEIFPKQTKNRVIREDATKPRKPRQKIKIISNKLVCRKFPTPDGKLSRPVTLQFWQFTIWRWKKGNCLYNGKGGRNQNAARGRQLQTTNWQTDKSWQQTSNGLLDAQMSRQLDQSGRGMR